MSILHSVNKSPFTQNTLKQCLDVIGNNHALILIEDGVYAALKHSPCSADLKKVNAQGIKIYALDTDISMRGLNDDLSEWITPVSMNDFVELCCQHSSVQSWY